MQIDRPSATVVIFVLTIVLIFFFVSPKYNEFKNLQIQEGEREAEYNGKYGYYVDVNRVYEELQKYEAGVKRVDNAIPDQSSFGSLVYFFQQKSIENGLIAKSLSLIKISPINPESNIKEIIFSVNLVGNYSSFKNFISSLEKSARLFEVNNISFSSPTSAAPAPKSGKTQPQVQQTYSFRLEIKTHSY